MKFDLLCVVGPTASGKSELAVRLALRFGGEIVSVDSMQIYRGMDIGTAKPDAADMRGVAHHMIDIADPDELYSAGRYAFEAQSVIRDVIGRGALPVLAGGTGLYFDALLSGSSCAGTPASEEIRSELGSLLQSGGPEALHAVLRECDPETAERLHPNNTKRIIRAIEVFRVTGKPLSEHFAQDRLRPPLFRALFIGLLPAPREYLYRRIDSRVDKMMSAGLRAEAEGLIKKYGELPGTAAQAIGYKEILPLIAGKASEDETAEEIKKRSRNYAKRQLTWFGRNKSIKWFEYSSLEEFENIVSAAEDFVAEEMKKEDG